MSLLYEEETYQINAAIYEVNKRLGCGFLEKVYQEALAKEFIFRSIPFEREKRFRLRYRDEYLEQEYVADFVCFGKIIIELKSVESILPVHKAQVINYLKATGMKLGILVNYGESYVKPIRIINKELID